MTKTVVSLGLALQLTVAMALVASPASGQAGPGPAAATTSLVCASRAGERQSCAADTTRGVTLVTVLGSAMCEQGRTWGSDDKGIWVSDGCSAVFSVATEKPTVNIPRSRASSSPIPARATSISSC